MWSRQTESLNVCCDRDFEHSNLIFSLDTLVLWWSTIKLSLVAKELLIDETVIFWLYKIISPVNLTLKITTIFFLLEALPHNTQFGYKRFSGSKDILWTKPDRWTWWFQGKLHYIIVQELCESWGGCPGLSVLTSLLVSVDIKLYWTMLRHWPQLVPNMSTDIWGH